METGTGTEADFAGKAAAAACESAQRERAAGAEPDEPRPYRGSAMSMDRCRFIAVSGASARMDRDAGRGGPAGLPDQGVRGKAVTSLLGALVKELEPAQTGLLGAFLVWCAKSRKRHELPKMDLPILDDLNEGKIMPNEIMREQVARWADQQLAPQLERSRVEGRAEGRAEGQVAVMRRMAARKFGAETAERLAGRLAELADPERAVEIGEWLIECESGEELLARVEGLCESSAAGHFDRHSGIRSRPDCARHGPLLYHQRRIGTMLV